jgi:hypothetical protein
MYRLLGVHSWVQNIVIYHLTIGVQLRRVMILGPHTLSYIGQSKVGVWSTKFERVYIFIVELQIFVLN